MFLLKTYFLSFLLIFINVAHAIPSQESHLSLKKNQKNKETNESTPVAYQLDFSSKAAGFNEGEDSASQVLFGFSPKFSFQLTPSLTIDADASINLGTGREQSRYESLADKRFVLNELSMNITPLDFAKFSLGALNQSHLDSPFLVTDISFPGLGLKLESQFKQTTYGYLGQYLIPTSSSFDSDRTSEEPMPYFQTHGLFAEYKGTSNLVLSGQVNLFRYSDLPAVVAYESKRLGNSVIGEDVGDSNFATEFAGLSQAYLAHVIYNNSIEQKFKISILENSEATEGLNRAQILETSLILKTDKVDIIPSVAYFYAEQDVAPAYYNSSAYGHNNRKGFKYTLRSEFNQNHFALEATYVDAKVINESVYQKNLASVEIFMEMLNVKF